MPDSGTQIKPVTAPSCSSLAPHGLSQLSPMAKRKFKLTWQKGTGGRPGRWRKIINGKAHYFDGGKGKSDQIAYKAALAEYEKLRAEITATQTPHRAEYLATIREWEAVAIWSKENGDQEQLGIAEAKIRDLESRLTKRNSKPLARDDQFVTQVGYPFIKTSEVGIRHPEEFHYVVEDAIATMTTWDHQKEVWRDRLATIKHREGLEGNTENSVGAITNKFIAAMTRKYRDGALSPGRLDYLQASTALFRAFIGSTKDLEAVNGPKLSTFFEHLQNKVDTESCSASTGRDHATNVAQFLRWAWKQEHIETLPRNLSDHGITVAAKKVRVFTAAEIKTLLTTATSRSQMYILMALNLGMTQQDMSDLHPGEVNWRKKTITRKRSKTKRHKDTPTVAYKMWPETLALLKQFQTKDKKRVLLNKFGLPLKDQEHENGKYRKTDTVGREFRRLEKRCKIKGRSFICLKKTSRSLLEDNRDFQPIAELFVGRAPKTVSEKHYAKPPESWLADATDWLRVKLEIAKIFDDLKNANGRP